LSVNIHNYRDEFQPKSTDLKKNFNQLILAMSYPNSQKRTEFEMENGRKQITNKNSFKWKMFNHVTHCN